MVGAGAAGTAVAHAMQQARPDWSIALFDRTERIGGRLRSVHVPDLDHPMDLGGMRYLTSHRRRHALVGSLGIPTHPFDPIAGPERSFRRGRFGSGPTDPEAGASYVLRADERGRSAVDLGLAAFERIVPGASQLDAAGWARARATNRCLGRRLTDWSIGEAVATVRSPEGQRFMTDAFGYDSGA